MLCWQPIDRVLAHPHPDSVTLDHVIPRSRGGRETRANLWPAHLRCNIARGNRPPPPITPAMVAGLTDLQRVMITATLAANGAVPSLSSTHGH